MPEPTVAGAESPTMPQPDPRLAQTAAIPRQPIPDPQRQPQPGAPYPPHPYAPQPGQYPYPAAPMPGPYPGAPGPVPLQPGQPAAPLFAQSAAGADTMFDRLPAWVMPAVVSGCVVFAALVIGGGGFALGRLTAPPERTQMAYAPAPAPVAAAAVVASDTIVASDTVASAPTTEAGAAPTTAAKNAQGVEMVAYRSAGAVWVAEASGKNAKKLTKSSQGAYSIAPDGKHVAVADTDSGNLLVIDVGTGKAVSAGGADDVLPSWAPNGSFVVFSRSEVDKELVIKANADGSGSAKLTVGNTPQVSPDGKSVYFILTNGQDSSGDLCKVDVASPAKVTYVIKGTIWEFAVAKAGVTYVVGDATQELYRATLDGKNQLKLIAAAKGADGATWAKPRISPNGKYVVVDEQATGYSKMFVVPWAGGKAVAISGDSTDYVLGWNLDGTKVYFITGAMPEGSKTKIEQDLMSIAPDGAKRTKLVAGATF